MNKMSFFQYYLDVFHLAQWHSYPNYHILAQRNMTWHFQSSGYSSQFFFCRWCLLWMVHNFECDSFQELMPGLDGSSSRPMLCGTGFYMNRKAICNNNKGKVVSSTLTMYDHITLPLTYIDAMMQVWRILRSWGTALAIQMTSWRLLQDHMRSIMLKLPHLRL